MLGEREETKSSTKIEYFVTVAAYARRLIFKH